ncbi:MAG: prephenate dehydrogenase [Candidatus Altiarchaeota archaeon]
MKKKLSIIGFGRFGQVLAKFLTNDFEVFVTDKVKEKEKEAKKLGVKFVSLKEASSQKIVVLATPISKLKNVLLKIKPFLKENVLVLDTCSVKEYPVKLMKKILPKYVEILGTHPLFGPDSVKNSLKDRKIVLCPIRTKIETLTKVKKYLRSKGLEVIVASPQEHDKQVAKTLCLVQFIGRALLDMKVKEHQIDTLSYRRLLKILETVKKDTKELFYDMHHYNKYSKNFRRDFIDSLVKIDKKIKTETCRKTSISNRARRV